MMTHIGWVADDQIEATCGCREGEILVFQREAVIFPELRGGLAVVRIKFKAMGFGYALLRKGLDKCGIERTRTDCRVEKVYFLVNRHERRGIAEDVLGKRAGGSKLSKAVALGLSFSCIEGGLQRQALLLCCVILVRHIQIPNRVRSSMRCSQTQSIPSAAS